MARPTPKTTISPRLRRIIERQERETERLGEQFGDPKPALMAFVREHFDEDAMAGAALESREGRNFWNKSGAHE